MNLINKTLLKKILNGRKLSLTDEGYDALDTRFRVILDRACIRCKHKAPGDINSHLKAIHV